jgi:hypothetical protein
MLAVSAWCSSTLTLPSILCKSTHGKHSIVFRAHTHGDGSTQEPVEPHEWKVDRPANQQAKEDANGGWLGIPMGSKENKG